MAYLHYICEGLIRIIGVMKTQANVTKMIICRSILILSSYRLLVCVNGSFELFVKVHLSNEPNTSILKALRHSQLGM